MQDREPGAILGARPHSQPRTATDAHRERTPVLSVNADPPDQSGRLVGPTDQMVTATAVHADTSIVVIKSGRVVEQAGTEGP
jgi:hypothetical protein